MAIRNHQTARYARWSGYAALALVLSVAGVYGYRAWQRYQAAKQRPNTVPPTVKQSSAEFTFSKVEQERTLFTVTASHTTEFTEGNMARLDDVRVTIFGRAGARADRLHTRACEYMKDSGRMNCVGEVKIELESAEDARKKPGARVIHVTTSNVTFDSKQDLVQTGQPVYFEFPEGRGNGRGVIYHAADAVMHLGGPVELQLAVRPGTAPITVSGAKLDMVSKDRKLLLAGPVRARQGGNELAGEMLTLELDPNFRAQRLLTSGDANFHLVQSGRELALNSKEMEAWLRPDGTIARISATGSVRGQLNEPARQAGGTGAENTLMAERIRIEMDAAGASPQFLEAQGRVQLEQRNGPNRSRLETESLRVGFATDLTSHEARLSYAETQSAARANWQTKAGSGALNAGSLRVEFGNTGKPAALSARQNVQIERRIAPQNTQRASSAQMTAKFDAGGEWSELEQTGNVHIEDGLRVAEAARAVFVRASDTLVLSGASASPATIADGTVRTSAQDISLQQRSGEMRADGGVRTNYRQATGANVVSFNPQQVNISAARLVANTNTGRALYSGGARFWQGEVVIQADTIELERNPERMQAQGRIHAVFPQQSSDNGGAARILWQGRAGSLTYAAADGRARLSDQVVLSSSAGDFRCAQVDLFLGSAGNGPREVQRAVATGGVIVRTQSEGQDRRGNADRAEYSATEGKITLSGGAPTLFDAVLGTTRGDQLTYFLTGDKILVDSVQGTRTLTRARTEK